MAETNIALRSFTVTAVGFTALALPIACNRIRVLNNNASGGIGLIVSTDVLNAAAQEIIPAGDSRDYPAINPGGGAPFNNQGIGVFAVGTTPLAFRSAVAGNTDVVVTLLP